MAIRKSACLEVQPDNVCLSTFGYVPSSVYEMSGACFHKVFFVINTIPNLHFFLADKFDVDSVIGVKISIISISVGMSIMIDEMEIEVLEFGEDLFDFFDGIHNVKPPRDFYIMIIDLKITYQQVIFNN